MNKKENEAILIDKPYREASSEPDIKGRVPSMTYVSDRLIPETPVYIRWGWIVDMPEPNPHIAKHNHDYDEIVLHIGNDPANPEDLGGELEFVVGDEPVVINRTSALYLPRGVAHGPLTWRRVTRPHLEMAITIGTGNFSKVIPGGYQGV